MVHSIADARNFRRRFSRTARASSLLVGSAIFISPLAHAAEQADSSARNAGTIEEVVVTAQRREETVEKVPLAVTAITAERIDALNLRNLPDLKQVTPGMQFNTGISYAQVYIRGVGYPNTTPGVETSVATYIDGAYLERGFGSAFDVLDPATLQVLKGPQGTLWGRNATGGAILINTADPTMTAEGKAKAEFGNEGHGLGEAVINVPLSDTVAVRVAGRYREEGGYVKNLAGGDDLGWSDTYTTRAKLLFEPGDSFRAVALIQLDKSKSSQGLNAQHLPIANCLVCGASQYTLPVKDPYTTVNNHLTDDGDDESLFYNLRMTYSADAFDVTSVTAYRDQDNVALGDFDYTEIPAFSIMQLSGSKTFTQDVTLTTNFDSKINATAGVSLLSDESYILLDIYDTPKNPGATVLDNEVYTNSFSVFAEATAELMPDLNLAAGGRWTADRRHTSSQHVDFDKFTPRVVLAYGTGPFNMYVGYNEGFKAGGFSTPAANPLTVYEPEEIKSYEAGLKYLSGDGRRRANVAVFDYKHESLQVLAVDQSDVGNISQTQNADSKGQGMELDGEFRPNDVLLLFGGAAYLSAEYSNFEGAIVQFPNDEAGNPTGDPTGPMDLTGYRLPQAPEWTAFMGATFTFPVGTWQAELTGFLRYTDEFDFYPAGGGPLGADMQPSYTFAKLNGSVTPASERYRIGFFIDNLTDETYYDFRYTTAPFGGMQDVARPLTYGVNFEYRWGSR